jgi:hypothetical protein
MEKICSTCKELKSVNDFHKTKYGSDGYKTECKNCRKSYARRKNLEKGKNVRIDKSLETDILKICTKCKILQNKTFFNIHSSWCVNCRRKYIQNKYNHLPKFIPIVTETHKQCSECKQLLILSNFSKSKRGRLGLSSYCKPCSSKKQLKRVSKEDRRKQTQKYRDNNREWWRSLHRINQFNRTNKIKLVSDNTVTQEFIKQIYSIENCYYCNQFVLKKFRTLEHKQPLNKGGLHSSNNITMCCSQCNSSKKDKTEEEFKQYKIKNNE